MLRSTIQLQSFYGKKRISPASVLTWLFTIVQSREERSSGENQPPGQ
jgi:hypothetical protein